MSPRQHRPLAMVLSLLAAVTLALAACGGGGGTGGSPGTGDDDGAVPTITY